jgi:penicillin-binding protein 2
MYYLRLKIFVGLCIAVLAVALVRLAYLQLLCAEQARLIVSEMRIKPATRLPTLRGKIFDRNGQPLALDRPSFSLHISYELTCHADTRWQEGHILRQINETMSQREAEEAMQKAWADRQQLLRHAVELATRLGNVPRDEIESRIEEINNRIWELARYLWWRQRNPGRDIAEYRAQRERISPAQIVRMDLREMYDFYPLIELPDEKALLEAQLELVHMEGLSIRPEPKRSYPYGTTACQLLGWVGPGQERELELFEDDEYQRYLEGEVLGKEGIEKAFEPLLRGRRGQVVYDKDGNELSRIEPQYGNDVYLTLDVELQQKIEHYLLDPRLNENANRPCAAVVLDGATNDILAAVSTPVFDLNTVRRQYDRLRNDPNTPLRHRALEENYPPGSTAKPLVLLIGLEEGKIRADEIIHCTFTPPSQGWPRCLLQRMGYCHDARWEFEGGNNARNALRGSCNIYFSQLAHRLSGKTLQSRLFELGFGQPVLKLQFPDSFTTANPLFSSTNPTLRQSYGRLTDGIQHQPAENAESIPPIRNDWERKFWGIGQGNLRATVLQVANALAAIARNGVYKTPRLVMDETDFFNERHQRQLNFSLQTFKVVRDGMAAVVNEEGGSAYRVFHRSELFERGLKIFGKTGSTQNPEHAWFECFAEDKAGRLIVLAVLVEGGARGSDDAAPLGHAILKLCSDIGYIGERPINAEASSSSATGVRAPDAR